MDFCQGCITFRLRDRFKLLLLNLKITSVDQVSPPEVTSSRDAVTSRRVGVAMNDGFVGWLLLDWLLRLLLIWESESNFRETTVLKTSTRKVPLRLDFHESEENLPRSMVQYAERTAAVGSEIQVTPAFQWRTRKIWRALLPV
jgi:hypothetical protein